MAQRTGSCTVANMAANRNGKSRETKGSYPSGGRIPRVGLMASEELLLDARPHLLYFALHVMWGSGIILAMILGAWAGGWFGDALHYVVLSSLLVWSLWTGWHVLQWWFTHFQITSRRVIWRTGVVARHGVEIPLDRINNVNFHQTIGERLVGAGDLVIESAGSEGQSKFEDIRHPDDVQLLIHKQMEAMRGLGDLDRRGFAPPVGLAPGAVGGQDKGLGDQLEKLMNMRDRGALTEDEFLRAKKRLLD